MIEASFWARRRVLLTGHTGFKGSWLLLWLQHLGAEVWGYSLEPDKDSSLFKQLATDRKSEKGWHHQIGNLADKASLEDLIINAQPEVVFHLAAQPLVRQSYKDPLGTWSTNVIGSLNLLEALRPLSHACAVVMITTDKVYQNREWVHGYREIDRLGGHDPYSASKAAAEIAIDSWRASFCGYGVDQSSFLRIATARAGNVIGGGDWAADRIVPDAIRSLAAGKPINVRNPSATRPWQHVLEPLGGYLCLAEALSKDTHPPSESFNFGPTLASNRSVRELVTSILDHWPGSWVDQSNPSDHHEANLLHLQIDKALNRLRWQPRWDFTTTVTRTVAWYLAIHGGGCPIQASLADLEAYTHEES